MQEKSKDIILIVDDNTDNLQLAASFLVSNNYDVAVAGNSPEALEVLKEIKPDLILLDVMMPEINGFQLCTLIKGSNDTKNIPVIFLTAMKEAQDIVRGFEVGGVDFVSKPFNKSELLARVQTHIELKKSRDLVDKQNKTLVEKNKQLEKLDNEKNGLLAITSHDLKNPLSAINNYLEVLETNYDKIESEQLLEIVQSAKKASKKAIHITSDLITLHEFESGVFKTQKSKFDVYKLTCNILHEYELKAKSKNIKFNYKCTDDKLIVNSDESKIERIISNLVSNALKFSEKNKNIWINIIDLGETFHFLVKDEGPGIKKDEQKQIFTKFSKISNRPTGGESSSKLGLSIVKLIVEKLGGRVWFESEYGKGSTFYVELPVE